jgi:CRP/FNR family cyclic AMP-dependent transcriptional regulator
MSTNEKGDPFAHLPMSESLRTLARRGAIRRYRKGTILIEEGDRGDTIFIILSGRLRAYALGERDREITYGVYGPGEYLGEMSLDGGPRSATVVTLEAAQCSVVTRYTLLVHLREQPEFALELLTKVIRRARAATLSAKQLALNDVYGRLSALFLELSIEQTDGSRLIPQRLTHRDIAGRLGCGREMVSRLMKDLEKGGYLAASKASLSILKPLPPRW